LKKVDVGRWSELYELKDYSLESPDYRTNNICYAETRA